MTVALSPKLLDELWDEAFHEAAELVMPHAELFTWLRSRIFDELIAKAKEKANGSHHTVDGADTDAVATRDS